MREADFKKFAIFANHWLIFVKSEKGRGFSQKENGKSIFVPTLIKSNPNIGTENTQMNLKIFKENIRLVKLFSLAVLVAGIKGKCSIPEPVSGGLAALLRLFGDRNQSRLRPAVRKFRLRYLCSRPLPQLRLTGSAKVLKLYNHY
jgi:hypothetical protein